MRAILCIGYANNMKGDIYLGSMKICCFKQMITFFLFSPCFLMVLMALFDQCFRTNKNYGTLFLILQE